MVQWYSEMLKLGYEEVEPLDFYRDIFPLGSLQKRAILLDNGEYSYEHDKDKYCGIAVEISNTLKENEKPIIKRYSITDDLDIIKELLKSDNFVILSPISYVGKTRATENARVMYAFALEIDNLLVDENGFSSGLRDLLHQMRENILPQANYLVTSGNGVHLYFVFDQPLRLFDNVKKSLSLFKRYITQKFWSSYITFDNVNVDEGKRVQYESAFQGFRLVGGVTKTGERTHVFRINNHPITIEYLNEFAHEYREGDKVVNPKIEICYESFLTLKEAKEKYPEWYQKRIIEKKPKNSWIVKRALYDWWLRRIREEITVGHRYYALMLLSVYAIKCNISYDELERDCFSLLKPYDNLSEKEENRFKESDVMSALQVYEDKGLVRFPINSICKYSGLKIEKNKRNKLKQEKHLFLARRRKEDLKFLGEKINEGRPKGSGEKRNIVLNWRLKNPLGKKAQCIKETGLSKPTVYKWWDYKYDISFSRKKRLFKEMKNRYKFNDEMSEKEKEEMRRIDYIHELLKLIGIHNYEWAKSIYKNRKKS